MYKGRAVLGLGRAFVGAPTAALLLALAGRVARNGGALEYFKARPAAPPELPPGGPDFTAPDGAPLKTQQVGVCCVDGECECGGGGGRRAACPILKHCHRPHSNSSDLS